MNQRIKTGIESNPILFSEGVALPPNPKGDINDPQNLWSSIENMQEWSALRILGQTVNNMQIGEPFTESVQFENTADKIVDSDKSRSGTDRYSAGRNAESLAAFLGVHRKMLFTEFHKASVLDVGSGEGLVADDLRRRAKSVVTELDFSANSLVSAVPILDNRGARIVGDGTAIPLSDASYDKTISMFSTFVHANTIRSRLLGLTEAIRVTRPGGRLFVAPLFGLINFRASRWQYIENNRHNSELGLTERDITEYQAGERQESAIDYALHRLLRNLMINRTISITPVLKFEIIGNAKKDIISAIIDVHKTMTSSEAAELVETEARPFTRI